jgi:O-antigen/teichoic acid export membrane protein
MMVGAFISSPGISIAQSAFAEGSNKPTSGIGLMRKTVKISLAITIASAAFVYFAAPYVLLIFGQAYRENSAWLLRLIALASPLIVLNHISLTFLRLTHQLWKLLIMSLEIAVFVMGFSILKMDSLGINSIGYGLLFGNAAALMLNIRLFLSIYR